MVAGAISAGKHFEYRSAGQRPPRAVERAVRIRSNERSRPSSSMDSKSGGEMVENVTAERTIWKASFFLTSSLVATDSIASRIA